MKFKLMIISIVSTFIVCGVLCSTFVDYEVNDRFFLLFPFAVSIVTASLLAFILAVLKKNVFRFTLADWLITAGVIYYVLRYDYQLRIADWKVIYAVLLLLLWYVMRVIFSSLQISKNMLSVGIIVIGSLIAFWGILQLYGFCNSNHFFYRITGPFINPGPYSGYLAMLLPICFHNLLLSKDWQRYYWWGAFALMFCIIPATMSRSAWLAISVSLLWVLEMHNGWLRTCRLYVKENLHKAMGLASGIGILVMLTFIMLFHLKADSVRGRLFIWKNTYTAMIEKPLTGYGPGSFHMVYGKAQAAYFAADDGTAEERRVAGFAEYAFNDYLQSCVEGGCVLLLLILLFGIVVFRKGLAYKQYGFCGALFSLSVFALSSYPLQVLSFGIAFIVFSAVCVSLEEQEMQIWKRRNLLAVTLSCLLCIGAVFGVSRLYGLNELGERWNNANLLYSYNACNTASEIYESLYSKLNYHPTFLKSYAGSLYSEGKYLEACKVLERAKLVSCDSNIWNLQGRYYQMAGCYLLAEQTFLESLLLTPERIYPYYLLAKLYREPKFWNEKKARQMAIIVMTKSPKVYSKAIDEMRKEMSLLLSGYK